MFKYFKKKKFLSQVQNEKYGSIQLRYTIPEEGETDQKVLKKDLKIIKKAFKPYTKVKHIFPSIIKSLGQTADFDINVLGPNTFLPIGWGDKDLCVSPPLCLCYSDESKIRDLIQSLNLKMLCIKFHSYFNEKRLETVLKNYIEFVGKTDPSNGLPQIECLDCLVASNTPNVDAVLDNKLLISCSECGDVLDYPLKPKHHKKLMDSFYDWALKR
jgi:hypothetical protein